MPDFFVHYADNPAPRVLAHYRRFQAQLTQGGNAGQAGISVDIAGFRRYQGDWVGAVVTPWFIHLLLLPGGGTLWRNLPAGETLRAGFPAGDLEFTTQTQDDPDLPTHAFATVVAPLDGLPDQDAALSSAMQAMRLIFEPASAPPPGPEAPDTPPAAPLDRRGFFRRLAGRG